MTEELKPISESEIICLIEEQGFDVTDTYGEASEHLAKAVCQRFGQPAVPSVEDDAYYQPILEELVGALSNITELIENCISDGEASKLIKKHYSYLGAKQALAKYKEIK